LTGACELYGENTKDGRGLREWENWNSIFAEIGFLCRLDRSEGDWGKRGPARFSLLSAGSGGKGGGGKAWARRAGKKCCFGREKFFGGSRGDCGAAGIALALEERAGEDVGGTCARDGRRLFILGVGGKSAAECIAKRVNDFPEKIAGDKSVCADG